MKFSVITPALNINFELEQAIKSVKEQSFTGHVIIEHFVIFDNENITLPKKIVSDNYLLEYVKVPGYKTGPSNARNKGIDLATGDILCFLDADDIWTSDYLSRLVLEYRERNVNYVAGNGTKLINGVDTGRLVQPYIGRQKINDSLLWNVIGCPSGYSYRRCESTKDLRFNTELRLFEDWYFYLEINKRCGPNQYGLHLGVVTYCYRVSPTQSTFFDRNFAFRFSGSKDLFVSYVGSYPFFDRLVLKIQATRQFRRGCKKKTLFLDFLLLFLRPDYLVAQCKRLLKRVESHDKY